jgi:universal stress protein A
VAGFKRILCPIEFDEGSISALLVARDIAHRHSGKLYVLHVARIPVADMDSPIPIPRHPHWELEAKRRIKTIALEKLDDSVPYKVLVRTGIAESVILEATRDLRIDLIVMATHGRTGLAHLFLGSVAESVMRHSPCPVLVFRPASATDGRHHKRLESGAEPVAGRPRKS